MIEVQGLIFDYTGKRALHGLSFVVDAGTITALVGPNGAGKTTLMRCLAGLALPYAGNITVGDVDVIDAPRRAHRKIGFLQDFFGLYDDMTVERCLLYHAAAQGVPSDARMTRVMDTAERLDLTGLLDRKAGQLSRGQRQRLAIGQAIVHRPSLLLLDEPASGLDPEARQALSALLRHLRDQGITLIVSSHILSELEDYCTHMMVMRHGRLVAHGSVAALTGLADDRGTEDMLPPRRIHMTLSSESTALADYLSSRAQLSALKVNGAQASFDLHGSMADQERLLRDLIVAGLPVASFSAEPVTMQEIYNRSLADKAQPKGGAQ